MEVTLATTGAAGKDEVADSGTQAVALPRPQPPAILTATAALAPLAPLDALAAFAEFLRIDVANGDATADTISTYHREVGAWVAWCRRQNLDPTHAKRGHIEAYREELKARGLSVSTRSRKLSIIRRFYDAAVKHELLKSNPADKVKGGKDLTPPEEKIKALTEGALGALVLRIPGDTLSGKRDRAVVGLMAIHGLRRIEVTRLDHASLQHKQDAPCLIVHGKGNKVRTVYLREDTHATLLDYIAAKLEKGVTLEGALFVAHGNHKRGVRLSRRGMNRIVDRYLNATALKRAGVSCHALRHTFGTLAVSGGAELVQVQAAMGHQDPATTALYVKAIERVRKNPANFIGVRMHRTARVAPASVEGGHRETGGPVANADRTEADAG